MVTIYILFTILYLLAFADIGRNIYLYFHYCQKDTSKKIIVKEWPFAKLSLVIFVLTVITAAFYFNIRRNNDYRLIAETYNIPISDLILFPIDPNTIFLALIALITLLRYFRGNYITADGLILNTCLYKWKHIKSVEFTEENTLLIKTHRLAEWEYKYKKLQNADALKSLIPYQYIKEPKTCTHTNFHH